MFLALAVFLPVTLSMKLNADLNCPAGGCSKHTQVLAVGSDAQIQELNDANVSRGLELAQPSEDATAPNILVDSEETKQMRDADISSELERASYEEATAPTALVESKESKASLTHQWRHSLHRKTPEERQAVIDLDTAAASSPSGCCCCARGEAGGYFCCETIRAVRIGPCTRSSCVSEFGAGSFLSDKFPEGITLTVPYFKKECEGQEINASSVDCGETTKQIKLAKLFFSYSKWGECTTKQHDNEKTHYCRDAFAGALNPITTMITRAEAAKQSMEMVKTEKEGKTIVIKETGLVHKWVLGGTWAGASIYYTNPYATYKTDNGGYVCCCSEVVKNHAHCKFAQKWYQGNVQSAPMAIGRKTIGVCHQDSAPSCRGKPLMSECDVSGVTKHCMKSDDRVINGATTCVCGGTIQKKVGNVSISKNYLKDGTSQYLDYFKDDEGKPAPKQLCCRPRSYWAGMWKCGGFGMYKTPVDEYILAGMKEVPAEGDGQKKYIAAGLNDEIAVRDEVDSNTCEHKGPGANPMPHCPAWITEGCHTNPNYHCNITGATWKTLNPEYEKKWYGRICAWVIKSECFISQLLPAVLPIVGKNNIANNAIKAAHADFGDKAMSGAMTTLGTYGVATSTGANILKLVRLLCAHIDGEKINMCKKGAAAVAVLIGITALLVIFVPPLLAAVAAAGFVEATFLGLAGASLVSGLFFDICEKGFEATFKKMLASPAKAMEYMKTTPWKEIGMDFVVWTAQVLKALLIFIKDFIQTILTLVVNAVLLVPRAIIMGLTRVVFETNNNTQRRQWKNARKKACCDEIEVGKAAKVIQDEVPTE